ncbi:MAG: single-stranded DNA-binding protein [Puniceicoccales bacterium]|jgi:single-strand DNA-binding protein|nr:single-stranded DNA-binding protein [Puniceicoccales bacterium]
MASYNKVILAGNITRDPEMRTLPTGMAITKFGLAINRVYTTKEGDRREEVTFIDIDSFGKQAETIAKYCTKGSALLVEGRLRLDQWDDKNTGEKRSRLGVTLEGFSFLNSRSGTPGSTDSSGSSNNYEDSAPPPRRTTTQPNRNSPNHTHNTSTDNTVSDEDVPF